jgi:hypothetical protein
MSNESGRPIDPESGARPSDTDVVSSWHEEMPSSLKVIPTVYPTSPPLATLVHRFFRAGDDLDEVEIDIAASAEPLAILEALGPSPFPRGSFPLVGFLATTYDNVSRFALRRPSSPGDVSQRPGAPA